MQPLESLASYGRNMVKSLMRRVASILDHLSGGRLHPNQVTMVSLAGHIFVAYLIATRHPIWAGVLLVGFGLLDAVDGELARLQNRVTKTGMLLDSISDRAKEILLYTGAAYFFIVIGYPFVAVWAVVACGASMLVSYVNAWAEATVANTKLSGHEMNWSFRSGLMSYDIRMFLFVAGLFTALLPEMLIIISVASLYTTVYRLVMVIKSIH